jgi:16S rRNA processing protein RimM
MSRSERDDRPPWRPERFVVGRVGRAHGLDGSVHLEGFGGGVPIEAGTTVRVGDRDTEVTARKGTPERPILRLAGVDDRTAADALRGLDVTVAAAAAPAPGPDEYFHVDLVGCAVRAGDRPLGTVAAVLSYPANDVLDVRGDEEVLVPFVADVVTDVDVPGRRITIRPDFL